MLKIFNIGAVILELVSIDYFKINYYKNNVAYLYIVSGGNIKDQEFLLVTGVHAFSIIWSVFYHLFPGLQTSTIYKWIAHAASTLIVAVFILNVVIFILEEDGWGKFGLLHYKISVLINSIKYEI